MNISKPIIWIFAVQIILLGGCSLTNHAQSVGEVKSNKSLVNYSDGITKQEAIYLSQEYLLMNPPPKNNPSKMDVDIFKVLDVYEADEYINVNFDFQFTEDKPFLYPFYWLVRVDKKSGEILKSKFSGHK